MMQDDDDHSAGTDATGETLDDDEDTPDWRIMERKCRRLRRNNITSFRNVEIYNDSYALQLASCLISSTSLKHAGIVVYWDDVSLLGAQALAKGIENSPIESFTITTNDIKYSLDFDPLTADCWKVLWCISQPALKKVRKLKINVPLSEAEILNIGQELINCNNGKLHQIALDISFATEEGVRALWKGIQKHRISNLLLTEISSEQVYRVLLSFGILRSSTLRHLNVSACNAYEDTSSIWDWRDVANLGRETRRPTEGGGLLSLMLIFSVDPPQFHLNNHDVKQLLEELHDDNKNLKRVTLDGNMISDGGVVHLVSCWNNKWPMLERLDLSRNKVDATGLSRLVRISSEHPSFTTLTLCDNRAIGREGLSSVASELIDALKSLQLRHLCLESCGLTDQDMGVLSKGLCNNSTVKALNLAHNKIGDKGVASLAECLNKGLLLEKLYLSCNKIGAVGVQNLVKASSAPSVRLKKLDVLHCSHISYEGLAMIAKELSTSKLSEFCVRVDKDKISASNPSNVDTAQRAACREARNIAGQALVAAVRANMNLRHLSLSLIDIPTRYKNRIEFFLDLEGSGKRLLRLDGGLNPFGLWAQVLACCRKSTSVLFYLLGEEPALIPTTAGQMRCAAQRTASSVTKRKRKVNQ